MASFDIEVSRTAEKQIKKLGREDQIRVLRTIRDLADEPRPRGCRKLRGYDDIYRIRVGTYRVIYSLDGDRIVIVILKVGHRREVYR
jgi:mRNA interferase RelE/StbE